MFFHPVPYSIGAEEMMEHLKNRKCHLVFNQRNLESVNHFSSMLKDIKLYRLTLSNLNAEYLKHITQALKGNTTVQELLVEHCDMEDEGARWVAEVLKDLAVNLLSISRSRFGDVGWKHLAQGLQESEVNEVKLNLGTIRDDGLKSIADVWKDGKIMKLDLNNSEITINSSKTISEMFRLTGDRNIEFNLYHPVGETDYIMDIWKSNSQYPYVSLEHYSFSFNTAEFINTTFGPVNLQLTKFERFQNHISLLKEMISRISIKELHIDFLEINTNIFKNILDMLQNYIVDKFELCLYPECMFLEHVRGSSLTPFQIDCAKENIPILGNILQSSGIRHLTIWMGSPLINYCIKLLINALKNTQVKHLEMRAVLDADTANFFADVIEHTVLVSVKFTKNVPSNVPTERYLEALARNKKTADEICSYFDNLVTFDLKSNEFQFRYPKNCKPLNHYVDFIALLRKNPNLRTHFKDDRLEHVDKIDQFVATIEDRFNEFINNNIMSLVDRYEDFDFIELVKEFDWANLGHIVQNLLLHRQLYYIDDRDEILHPFIYKMLHKYKMPLYDKQLEPDKKFDILNFYMEHSDIEDVQELFQLLEHVYK